MAVRAFRGLMGIQVHRGKPAVQLHLLSEEAGSMYPATVCLSLQGGGQTVLPR
jgi:hypothetical protein